MLWAFLFLVLNLSFVCLQRSSWYRTIESVQVAVRVNSIEASVFSAALNCLPMTWLQKNAFSRCLSQLLRPPFIFCADLFLMSTWYESKKSLQVTFRDEPFFHYVMLRGVFFFLHVSQSITQALNCLEL